MTTTHDTTVVPSAPRWVDGLPGCLARGVDTETGSMVGLYSVPDAGLGGLSVTIGRPWVTMCERHMAYLGHDTEGEARDELHRARFWCAGCKAALCKA